jgi:hypothetical protein
LYWQTPNLFRLEIVEIEGQQNLARNIQAFKIVKGARNQTQVKVAEGGSE